MPAVDEQLDHDQLAELRAMAQRQIGEMEAQLAEIAEATRMATSDLDVDLPDVEIPEPEVDVGLQGEPLLSSEWPWSDQTKALIARKSYMDGGAG